MTKTLFTIIAVLVLTATTYAQQSNVHLAADVNVSANMGRTPAAGLNAGGDLRAGKLAFSIDGDAWRIKKTVGGSGWQVDAREVGRYYFHKNIFVQGGAYEQHYSVKLFGKTVIAPLAGIGFERPDYVVQVNYLHDLTSNNGQRIVEGVGQFYLKCHWYLKATISASKFHDQGVNNSHAGLLATFAVGVHF